MNRLHFISHDIEKRFSLKVNMNINKVNTIFCSTDSKKIFNVVLFEFPDTCMILINVYKRKF